MTSRPASARRHRRPLLLVGLLAAVGTATTALVATPAPAATTGRAAAALSATALPAPTSVHVGSRAKGLYLTWKASSAATAFTVTRSTDAAGTHGVKTFKVNGTTDEFTPYGLVAGTQYWFRITARHGSQHSAPSAAVTAVNPGSEQGLWVVSYNLCRANRDGQAAGDGHIAPWSQRKVAAAALVKEVPADVIAVQEGSDYVDGSTTERQVDSFVTALGAPYALARTEIPPGEPHYHRTGRYIVYNSSTYAPVGDGGSWSIGDDRFVAYQIFSNLRTGSQFLFVSVHLYSGVGATNDQIRERETKTLLDTAGPYAAAHSVPVVYAGDFNSHSGVKHALDGPGVTMAAAHIADGRDVAAYRGNAQYNSANDYYRTPPASGDDIDHLFAPPGVSVVLWGLLLDLKNGKFVGTIPSDHNPLFALVGYPF